MAEHRFILKNNEITYNSRFIFIPKEVRVFSRHVFGFYRVSFQSSRGGYFDIQTRRGKAAVGA